MDRHMSAVYDTQDIWETTNLKKSLFFSNHSICIHGQWNRATKNTLNSLRHTNYNSTDGGLADAHRVCYDKLHTSRCIVSQGYQ